MNTRLLVPVFLFIGVLFSGCRRQPQPPPSAYDRELLDTARQIAEQNNQQGRQRQLPQPQPRAEKGQCSRETGGCQPGYICWDSYFCKQGFSDQCTASGDKRCHKLCDTDLDCPRSMPRCRTKPIFSGTEEGQEVRFCVEE